MNPRRFRTMTRRLIRRAGGGAQVTLRRHSTIHDRSTSAPITALIVGVNASTGDTSMTFLSAVAVAGSLAAGSQFTLAGHATTYTLTANAIVPAGTASNQAISVSFTPGLEDDSVKFDAVTLSRAYGDQVYDAQLSEVEDEAATHHVEGVTRRVQLAAGEGIRAPNQNDLVVSGLPADEVVKVRALEPANGLAVRWEVWVTSRAA